MSQQKTRAVSTIWMKRGLAWALGATLGLGCGGEAWEAEVPQPPSSPQLETISQRLQYGTHEYVVVTTAKNWLDAANSCASLGKGLVTLETSAESDWLLSQQPAGSVWIGANDRVVEGSWAWMDGVSTYTRWATGEPNNQNNEDCAVSATSNGKWNDVPCTLSLPFVCESFDTPQPKQYNGHDYTFFEMRKTWLEAKNSCEQMGQGLVSIKDVDEDLWLKQQAPGRQWWIGFNDQIQEGTWVWPDQPTWYTNWRAGEPNNQNNEDCAVGNAVPNGSAPAGSWNDLPCTELISYVCESTSASPVVYQYLEYSAANTNSATQGTTDVTIHLEPGQILEMGTCGLPGVSATNDTFLRLLGPDGLEVTSNDDACKGLGSRLRFRVPECGGGTYVIQAGCSEASSCGGRLGYTY